MFNQPPPPFQLEASEARDSNGMVLVHKSLAALGLWKNRLNALQVACLLDTLEGNAATRLRHISTDITEAHARCDRGPVFSRLNVLYTSRCTCFHTGCHRIPTQVFQLPLGLPLTDWECEGDGGLAARTFSDRKRPMCQNPIVKSCCAAANLLFCFARYRL